MFDTVSPLGGSGGGLIISEINVHFRIGFAAWLKEKQRGQSCMAAVSTLPLERTPEPESGHDVSLPTELPKKALPIMNKSSAN
eukprot:3988465-Amphidinium_carterae.1